MTLPHLDPNPTGSPAVLLLHGLGSCAQDWELQLPALTAAGYRPVAVDLPGFGRAPAPEVWTLEGAARAARETLEGLGIDAAHVVGISMGGCVALQLALDAPGWVRGLVLVNTFARLDLGKASWAVALYLLYRRLALRLLGPKGQAKAVARRIFPKPEQEVWRRRLEASIRASDPRAYRQAFAALARFDVADRLGEIRVPTLIVTGREDTTVPPPAQAHLRRIPTARQVVLDGAGHAPIADTPDGFNALLLAFLKEAEASLGAGREGG